MIDRIVDILNYPLGVLMRWCWLAVDSYGMAIILFTFCTKIVLLPISIWIQKNSILMVKLQPQINYIKAKFYGDNDSIAEEQSKLFKKEKYHPLLSLVPLVIQIVLLLSVVDIIYHPLTYLLGIDGATITSAASQLSVSTDTSSYELNIFELLHNTGVSADGIDIAGFSTDFLSFNLALVPLEKLGKYLFVPILAGLSSLILCITQNQGNVIQHEQGKLNKYGLMLLSVGLSLYLGCFVPAGIALYWIASNLFSVVQMYILNYFINPKKYVDYEALEDSRNKLAQLEALDVKDAEYKENKKREKADYKRFKSVANKHLVFYSEKSGYYKYFKDLINELLNRSNVIIHYVTNDPHDVIFGISEKEPRIRAYYIGLKKTVTLMMMMEADIVVMTTPDLDKYYIKRSYLKKDTEYIYVPHDMMSISASFNEGAFDNFDTIFCTGPHTVAELEASEKLYGTKQKKLVEFGYPLSDELIQKGMEYRECSNAVKEILIAPSWQEDNLLDSCIDKLIEQLYCDEYHITVRPHPEYVKRYKAKMDELVNKYSGYDSKKLTFELDFSTNKSSYSSDLLITDWSGIATEFCFATLRPALFVNTKYKCLNPNWKKLDITPVEISLRDKIGISIDKDKLETVKERTEYLLSNREKYRTAIAEEFDRLIYNHGTSASAGAKYILKTLSELDSKR